MRNKTMTMTSQVAVAQQLPRHVAHDVELVVAHAARAALQPQDNGDSLRRRGVALHGARPHRRRRDHLHVLAGNTHQVRTTHFARRVY